MLHPIRTLLGELFLYPILRVLQGQPPKGSCDSHMHNSRQHRAGTALAASSGANTDVEPVQTIAPAVTTGEGNLNPTVVEGTYVPYPKAPLAANPVYKPYAQI